MIPPEYLPIFGIITLVLVWVGLPTYMSWKYDISIKETFKSLWLYSTGRPTEARILLQEKEDRTKPIRWFFWIPFIGRLIIHQRDMKALPDLRRNLIISLIENTVLYFIVGLVVGYTPLVTLQTSLTVIFVVFMILIPVEYRLTMWMPKLFLSDGDIEYVEYVCVFYHAFLFIVGGVLLGNFLRVGCTVC